MFPTIGAVTLSPPGVAPVCSGGQLELICTTTGDFLQWRFNVTRGINDLFTFRRSIQATLTEEESMHQFPVNSTMFNFSRTSAQDSLPVMSKVVIGPISSGLNGTVMNCVDLDAPIISSSSTTIIVIEREPLQGMDNNGRLSYHHCYFKILCICMYSELE